MQFSFIKTGKATRNQVSINRSSAIVEGLCDMLCQLKSCQLLPCTITFEKASTAE